jgi:leucyl aminopeptidase
MMTADGVKECLLTGQGIITEDALAFVEGMALADYSFDRYLNKLQKHIDCLFVDSILVEEKDLDSCRRLLNRIWWCREWVNTPVADLNAPEFAEELESIAKDLGVKCTVLNKRQIESLRMGGLVAVNKGSVDEPRFVILEYKPKKAVNKKPLALVGKGIMYDTGGLNIKPDDYMQEMKSDMAGAATMASVVFAAAESQLPVWTVAALPLTDNRPGFNAYAADDILTMYNGMTVEVVNTDAEGRLILADAIAYAVDKFEPELLIDIATLTGAASRAIGPYAIAAMEQGAGNAMSMLKIMGEQVYERIAELPFWEEYDELLKSDMADMKNCGPGQAGAITAGKFLARFAGKTPYIHLDIAGVAYFTKAQPYYAVGASAYGMRLLYAFLQVYEGINA